MILSSRLRRNAFYSLSLAIILLVTSPLQAEPVDTCPDTLLAKFKVNVKSRQIASRLFAEFFSTEKNFPPFDESKIKGPYHADPSIPNGSFSYYGWYGNNEHKVGGLLYPNGILVQRGYCK